MIHQFSELGGYYREREGIGTSDSDQLALYTQDPAQKFRTNTVLLLVFVNGKFDRVQVEQYDDSKKLLYLYRFGSAYGCDATPTSGLRQVREKTQAKFEAKFIDEVRKKLARMGRAIEESVAVSDHSERDDLMKVRDAILRPASRESDSSSTMLKKVVSDVLRALPPEQKGTAISSGDAIISLAWQSSPKGVRRVGDFKTFRRALVNKGLAAASTKKGVGEIKGTGQCSICGKPSTQVSGLLQIPHFKLYTLDKAGSVSGGFDPSNAWRNFPACRECSDCVDFAGERVKKYLAFDYYGFKYLFLPCPVQPSQTLAYDFLDRLTAARVNRRDMKRLTAAEDEILYVVSEEDNLLQVDLLFYKPDPQSFRPALYVPGLLPTRFRELFKAKDEVDAHPWLSAPSPKSFTKHQFTFQSLRNVFPAAHDGGSTFDDDFLGATRAALEVREFSPRRMLQVGMRWVQQDYRDGKAWQFRLADLFRSVLFFEVLTSSTPEGSEVGMNVDYGNSEQADRVRSVLGQTSGRLRADPAAQAAFLVGACCSRIEMIQEHVRGAAPFAGKLKGFRLDQFDVQRLFVAAKDKAKVYGPSEEKKVIGLLECAAAALSATPDRWSLSPDEVSYYFALGHALRPRFAKDIEDTFSEAKT